MEQRLKNISWLLITLMLTLSVLLYICLMSFAKTAVHGCDSSGPVISNMSIGGVATCMKAHLSNIEQFTTDIANIQFFVLLGTYILLVYGFYFSGKEYIHRLMNRFRYHYHLYRIRIKSIIEKKVLHYLNILRSSSLASQA